LYAKIFDPSEFEGKTKDDLIFFDCDYILRCISGPFYNRQIRLKDLGDTITIGQSEKNKFSIKDDLISEVHCQLNYIEDSFYYSLEDCNSNNGTWIQILSIEDGYEVNENTDFKLFDHEFSIVFDEVDATKKKKPECIIKFTAGEKKGKKWEMQKGETIRIGKKDEKITLNMKVHEAVLIKVVSLNDKIYIIDETQEPYDGGLFMKLKNKILIRAGDCFKIGNSSFKLLSYNYSYFSEIGDRLNQEDKFIVCDDLRVFDDIIIPYFAVYDGHGGPSCSEFIRNNLHNEIHYYLKELVNEKSQNFLNDIINALQKIIILVDINYYDSEINYSAQHGSTCVFVFFIGTYALCCNLGDSVSILLRKNDKRVYLSRDFKPERELERQRIELKNGYITNDRRLLGIISVSRAFGDWKFKDKLKQSLLKNDKEFGEYLITNRAEFRLIELNPNVDKYIMLASDGLFVHGTYDSILHSLDMHLKTGVVENGLVNIPKALDNFRLSMIKLNNSDDKKIGDSDNMTMIAIKLFNDKSLN
jgi:serine/threonine protein phosphatase PrpC/pSer/pThr/pTyr-binding forkhead associated (FHA) protein